MGKFRPIPDDFAAVAATARSCAALTEHYKTKHKVIVRWMQELGLPKFPTNAEAFRKRPPSCFAEIAPTLSKVALCGRYQVSGATLNKWLCEVGVNAKPPTPQAGTERMGRPRLSDIPGAKRDSPEDIAADYLRKWMPVTRCNDRGKTVDGGKLWRVGILTLTSPELIAKANHKLAREAMRGAGR